LAVSGRVVVLSAAWLSVAELSFRAAMCRHNLQNNGSSSQNITVRVLQMGAKLNRIVGALIIPDKQMDGESEVFT
jgi:hypothetical protein